MPDSLGRDLQDIVKDQADRADDNKKKRKVAGMVAEIERDAHREEIVESHTTQYVRSFFLLSLHKMNILT